LRGCGNVNKRSYGSAVDYVFTKFYDIIDKIIPFFDTYSLQGTKGLYYADFRRIVEIMNIKDYLTPDGIDQIMQIKFGVNTGRDY
jgi:hypothetical protein